jgi:lipopolysaccharide transport system ATP-binding protein
MNDVVIRAENLGKLYRIGEDGHGAFRYKSLRDSLAALARKAVSGKRQEPLPLTPSPLPSNDHIWALRDVSFEVRPGEVVGIIGRNGAGKSTLLKILSRITEPTEGFAEIRGRVGSLLEVGTGFHPELTGRENIFLNGAILGMKKAEIAKKFDEIVAFAEVEKFIDTPVKHYSSGMYVRLAFAVAAHLDPEILLVDEVLAVGDAEFQRKCLGKISNVARQGRTVLFVSHNMAAVAQLCGCGFLLDCGRLVCNANAEQAIRQYQASAARGSRDTAINPANRSGSGRVRFKRVSMLTGNGELHVYSGCALRIRMELEASAAVRSSNVTIGIGINSSSGERLITLLNKYDPRFLASHPTIANGTVIECALETLPLREGCYYLSLYIDIDREIADAVKDAVEIVVHEADFYNTGVMPTSSQGCFLLKQRWSDVR